MLKLFLSILMMSVSFMMIFMNHPLSMGMMILMQTLLTCLLTGMLINTYWFSYILFLTFMGGLLVLFIYVCSVASNEIFNFKLNSMFFFYTHMLIILILVMIFSPKLLLINSNFNLEMNNLFEKYIFFNNENKINLSKLYNEQTFLMMMMMIIYLFITLIAMVKITNIFFGPLRMSFN